MQTYDPWHLEGTEVPRQEDPLRWGIGSQLGQHGTQIQRDGKLKANSIPTALIFMALNSKSFLSTWETSVSKSGLLSMLTANT